ncbi:MAG: ABC transporter permease [Parcubacteria group bacterium]|nr:ABC transporter permease [Parcubacteria group bacterium]MCR4342687.1 ABC transporter permease [Patescibacteria group bacterium]
MKKQNHNNKINNQLNSQAETGKISKRGDVFEFASIPDSQGFLSSLPIEHSDVPPDERGMFFVEFMDLISGQKEAGSDGLISRFFRKQKDFRYFFTELYWHAVFFINTFLDIIYIYYSKKFSRNKDRLNSFSEQDKLREIKIGEVGENESLVTERLSLDSSRKEKIELKTLALLSGRMFTSGSMRTILTILGISISIGVIMFLISFGYGLQKTVLQRITTEDSLLSLVVTLPEESLISKDRIEEIRSFKEVDKISPLVEYNGNMEMASVQIDASIFMVDSDYFSLAGLMSQDGTPLKIEEGNVVISSAIAILMGFEEGEAIGKKIKLSPTTVSGVEVGIISEEDIQNINKEKKSLVISGIISDDQSAFSYVLDTEFKDIEIDGYIEAKVKVRDEKSMDIIKEDLINKGYIISSISDTVDETRKIFRGIQAVLGFFGFIALIISAIGMLNIMTIVLLERTQEIGIMKAIGASNIDIWKIVISDAVIIGFLGGIGGSVIGIGTSKLFNLAFNILASRIGSQSVEIFQMPPGFMLVIITFSAVIGFATGIWPAIRASRIAPLEAIKYK